MEESAVSHNLATYIPMENVENLERYRPGGYHPVIPGDKLHDGRYTILSKLGYGGYSTVWMARSVPLQRLVALKIVIADESAASGEGEIRSLLRGHPGVQQLFDTFSLCGPNGTHRCFVSEPGGYSVDISKDARPWLFPLAVARAIAAQMVHATAFVHSHGIVHGDLHLNNWLLRIPFDLDALTDAQYLARYASATRPVQRLDGQPLSACIPPRVAYARGIGKTCSELRLADAGVLLADFGAAWCPAETDVYHLCTPPAYLPPEAALETLGPMGPGADIWTLAVSLYAVFARGRLIEELCDSEHDAFAQHVCLLGSEQPPLVAWLDAWSTRAEYFDAQGNWEPRRPTGASDPLEARLLALRDERRDFDKHAGVELCDEEFAHLSEMLRYMLRWEPAERLPADALMRARWMRDWGLPAKEAVDSNTKKST
ncbi:kinase-like protein [Auricularia subglabra TFB-10046 SS5]|nr:kinase-like protein [Auricularia subglabra TFB-10046 SS5]